MSSFLSYAARRSLAPLASAAFVYASPWEVCSAEEAKPTDEILPGNPEKKKVLALEEESFHGMFPKRQLWQPKLPYPLWDKDWDGRKPASTGSPEEDHKRQREIRKTGVTRHLILIRHGQYDETHKVSA